MIVPDRLPAQLASGGRSSLGKPWRCARALRLLVLIGLSVAAFNSFASSVSAQAPTAGAVTASLTGVGASHASGHPAIHSASHSSSREKAANFCVAVAARLPGVSLAECQGIKVADTGAMSRNGLPVLARRIAASSQKNEKPPIRILLIGGIHGDELTSSTIVFHWLRLMDESAARRFQWSVVPILNPDGMLTRKPTRINAAGVDLNRNFPTPGWQKEAPAYWAKATARDPRRYPGPSPLSEPETRWLNLEIERFKPQVVVSVHAPFGVLDLDGPARPPTRFGRLMFNRVGVYPGSLGNYVGRYRNIPVITIELPNASRMPSESEVQRIWQDMLAWIARSVEPGAARMSGAKALST
jgi:protein MpaA